MRKSDTTHHHGDDSRVHHLRTMLDDYGRRRARQAGWSRRFVSSGIAALDAALPHGGLPCGSVIEILSDEPGAGAMSTAFRIARAGAGAERSASTSREDNDQATIMLADTRGDFYPPAALQHGIALHRLIIVRTKNQTDAFWAVEQALACTGVAVVIAPLALNDRASHNESRRLQLAAERSGGIGLILGSTHRRAKGFAAVQMLVESVAKDAWDTRQTLPYGRGSDRDGHAGAQPIHHACSPSPDPQNLYQPTGPSSVSLCRITLLKVREGTPAEPFWVNLSNEAGALPVYSVPGNRSVAKVG